MTAPVLLDVTDGKVLMTLGKAGMRGGGAAWRLALVVLGTACTGLAYILFFRMLSRWGSTRSSLVARFWSASAFQYSSPTRRSFPCLSGM